MARPFGGSRESIGIHVDGLRIQLAHLRREGDQVQVLALRSAQLVDRLDVEPEPGDEEAEELLEEETDILGLGDEPTQTMLGTEEAVDEASDDSLPESNSEVLYQLLGDTPVKDASVALSVAEGRVVYADFPNGLGLKGRRLRRRLLDEASRERAAADALPLRERHTYITTDRGAVLSVTHEDPLPVIGLLDDLRPYVGKVQIGLVDTPEIALMNSVRLAYDATEQVTAIVYIGQDFSRIVFMQNGHYLAFSQPINEGARSAQVLNTVARRILFEQDLSGIPDIGEIRLSGECRTLDAKSYFAEQYPGTPVDYLEPPALDLSALDENQRDAVSSYIVPIGLAWKTLAARRAPVYPTNLLPEARRRQQNPFEIAWHGIILLGLLLVSFPAIGWKADQQARELEAMDYAIDLAVKQIEESQKYVEMVDDLKARIADYQHNLSLMDTLGTLQVIWSEVLQDWSVHFRAVDRIWLESLSTAPGNTDVQVDWRSKDLPVATEIFTRGRSMDRVRVSEMANRMGDGQVRSLVSAEVRERRIYDFDIVVPVRAGAGDTTAATATGP